MTALLVVRMQVDPGRRDMLRGAALELLSAARRTSGSLWAEASASIEDPEGVVVLAEWRTGADLDSFRRSEPWQGFLARTDVAVREDPSVRTFRG